MTMTPTGAAGLEVAAPPESAEAQQQREQNEAVFALLDSWLDVTAEEAAEQRDTLDFLMRALNEDRLSDRDRFA